MSVLGFLKKRDYHASVVPAGAHVLVKGGEKLLNAALAAGLDWPHDCRVGSCGTCRCRLVEGQIKRLTDFAYTLSQDEIAAGTILACQTLLKSDVTVEVALTAAGAMPVARHHGRIARRRDLTHDIQEIEIALEHGDFARARAGQYAELSLPDLPEPRSYSFARAPAAAGDRPRFFIRHVPGGAFTDWLFAADRTGTALELSGPYGNFFLRPGAGTMICVAGGSGLAPVYALLEDAVRQRVERECLVLFGARTRRDLYYLDELAALGREWRGRFELIPVLSEAAGDDGWDGARGLVTDELARRAEPGRIDAVQGYLCGPPPMVDAGIAALRALGLADGAIFYDKFLDASTQPGGRAAI